MKVTMDKVGRVVLPKPLRTQLGLEEHAEFEASVDGTAIRLELKRPATRQVKIVDGWPVLVADQGQTMTDDDVRRLRDEQR
jgi:bifunctional DNA-binding transcriptional regulator/antitoxin component of YhaV-PrlF toxin-antitoxin module